MEPATSWFLVGFVNHCATTGTPDFGFKVHLISYSELENSKIFHANGDQKKAGVGVPVVSQWLMNPTRNHEVAGLIPGLAQ